MRITEKKLRELIKDEKKASKEYRGYGFNRLAKQEHQHSIFLGNKLKGKTK